MAKVTFEFDETEDRQAITVIVNRHKLLNAINELCTLRRNIYKGYLPNEITVIKNNRVVCKAGNVLEDYDNGGTEELISTEYILNELGDIIRRY